MIECTLDFLSIDGQKLVSKVRIDCRQQVVNLRALKTAIEKCAGFAAFRDTFHLQPNQRAACACRRIAK